MTSFKMQIKGGSKVLKPALDAFGGGTDDDADAAGAASASGRGYGAGTSSAAGGAPPQPGANGNAQDLKSRGVAAAKAGDYAGALHLFAQAQLHGEDARIEEMRAQVLLLLGRDFEAVQAAERASRTSPDWPDAWLTLARAQLNLGEPQLAVESLQRLADLAPGHEALRAELPEARMLAARQRQQQGGGRARVVAPGGGAAAPLGQGGEGEAGGDEDPVDAEPMDGVDMTTRVYMPNT